MILGNHKKLVIIGSSGTGKSRLGRDIAALTDLPLYHIDSIIWAENWTEVDDKSIKHSLDAIADTDRWIVEGWIDHYSDAILKQADLVIYLDFPGWLAMWGGLQRWFRYRGKHRPELPPGCDEGLSWRYLYTMLMRLERPHIETILAGLNPKSVLRLKTRRAANRLLDSHCFIMC